MDLQLYSSGVMQTPFQTITPIESICECNDNELAVLLINSTYSLLDKVLRLFFIYALVKLTLRAYQITQDNLFKFEQDNKLNKLETLKEANRHEEESRGISLHEKTLSGQLPGQTYGLELGVECQEAEEVRQII